MSNELDGKKKTIDDLTEEIEEFVEIELTDSKTVDDITAEIEETVNGVSENKVSRNSVGSASDGSSSVADRLTALEEKFDKVTNIIESGFANLNTSVATVDVVNTLWNGSGGEESRKEGFGLNGIADSANGIQGTTNIVYGDVKEIKKHTSVLETRFNSVNSSHNSMQTDLNNIKSHLSTMRTDILSVDRNMSEVKTECGEVKTSIEKIEKKVAENKNTSGGGIDYYDAKRAVNNSDAVKKQEYLWHHNWNLFTLISVLLTVLSGFFTAASYITGFMNGDLFLAAFSFIVISVILIAGLNILLYINYLIKYDDDYNGWWCNNKVVYCIYITAILLFSCVAFGLSCALIFNF